MKPDNVGLIWKKILTDECELYEHEKPFFPRLAEKIHAADKVLEIGVGRGRMIKLLKESGVNKNAKFYAVDLNEMCDAEDVSFRVADTRALPFENDFFDITYSLGVVEHMPVCDTFVAVAEHVRVTKRGGYILISVPAMSILFTPIRYLIYLLKFKKMGTFAEVVGRNITNEELTGHISKLKCRVLEISRSGVYLPKTPLSLRKKIEKIIPLKMKAYLWILAQKK